MKISYIISTILFATSSVVFAASGSTYNSYDEQSGDWDVASTWNGSAPTTLANNDVININGTVTIYSNKTITKQITINVNDSDTLIVNGTLDLDYTSASGEDIQILGSGVIIVLGTLTTKGNLNVDNDGKLIVLGDFTTDGAGTNTVDNDGSLYVVGGITDITVDNGGGAGFQGGLEELIGLEPDIIELIVDQFPDYLDVLTGGLTITDNTLYTTGKGTGNWSDTESWSKNILTSCNCIPDVDDSVVIQHAINFDVDATVYYLSIDNNASIDLTGAGGATLTVSDELTLTSGYIYTNSSNLLALGDGITISGGSDASFVDGPIQRTISTTLEVVFPVGKNGVYAPIGFELESASSSVYTAEYFDAAYSNVADIKANDGLINVSTQEYWDLHQNSVVGGYITLYYLDAARSGVHDPSSLVVAHWNSTNSEWENMGVTATTSSSVRSGLMTSFSPITPGGGSGGALPVELVDFSVYEVNGVLFFDWITASEKNNDLFTLEVSVDGIYFEPVAFVSGNGTTSVSSYYSATDTHPKAGESYYRLKQTDTDGTVSYSHIINVYVESHDNVDITIFPTIVSKTELVHININGTDLTNKMNVKIFSQTGNLVLSETIEDDFSGMYDHEIYTDTFETGIYTVFCVIKGEQFVNKLIVK